MKKLTFILIAFFAVLESIGQEKIIKLNKKDCFVIAEFKKVEYQFFNVDNNYYLPSALSFINHYVDINGLADSNSISDINYLYLDSFSVDTKTEGVMYYLLTRKSPPFENRKSGIIHENKVDQYADISSIVDIQLGVWKKVDDDKIIFIFRDKTKIKRMEDLRIFAGLIVNKSIFLNYSMNTKDAYLSEFKLKHRNKVEVRLPLRLDQIFDTTRIVVDIVGINKENGPSFQFSNEMDSKKIKNEDKNKKKQFFATVKYWPLADYKTSCPTLKLFDFDSLSLKIEVDKFQLNSLALNTNFYKQIKIHDYKKYFDKGYQKRLLTLKIISPYLDYKEDIIVNMRFH